MKSKVNLEIKSKTIFRMYNQPSADYTLRVTFRSEHWKENIGDPPYTKKLKINKKIWQ